jgi:hypothetical protein
MNLDLKKILGVVCLLYLANIGAGLIEFIPDIIPVFGNVDEGAAAVLAYKLLLGK